MASNKRALAICDTCGFQYPHRVLKMNSYGMLVCPTDYEGAYDLKNHPQNRTANVRDDESIRNPRPPLNNDRNLVWNNATNTWENYDTDWNMI
jgi:hypothetical protein